MSKKRPICSGKHLRRLNGTDEPNCRVLERQLSKLSRRNRSITILAVAAFGYAVWSEAQRRKQEEQVYQLSLKVKKLEYSEGE